MARDVAASAEATSMHCQCDDSRTDGYRVSVITGRQSLRRRRASVAVRLSTRSNLINDNEEGSTMQFAFISRHVPTQIQHELAADQGIILVHVGDTDAFTAVPGFVDSKGAFEGVVVVHPAAALRLAPYFLVGIFENANRAPEGAPPSFEAVSLQVFDMRGPHQ